jgi:hypothetical protein
VVNLAILEYVLLIRHHQNDIFQNYIDNLRIYDRFIGWIQKFIFTKKTSLIILFRLIFSFSDHFPINYLENLNSFYQTYYWFKFYLITNFYFIYFYSKFIRKFFRLMDYFPIRVDELSVQNYKYHIYSHICI